MKILLEIFQYIPAAIIGFILLAIAIRIIAKISIMTFFEIQKEEKDDPKNK